MAYIVVYSSRTGNTKQVAEAIAKALPEGTECVSVKDAPASFADYDGVFMGFWADQGNANKEAQPVIQRIDNKKVALFATLGVPPMMPHAEKTIVAAAGLLPNGTTPVGMFKCQGKVDPKVIEMMYKIFRKGTRMAAVLNVTPVTPRRLRIRMQRIYSMLASSRETWFRR